MRKVKGLNIYAEELPAEKKFKLARNLIFVANQEAPAKLLVHLNGRFYGKFLWDRILCQKVCKVLGVPRKDLFEKDEDGKTQLRVDFLRNQFNELTGYESYWDNLQKMLDIVATYNYGKNVKHYDFDASSNRTPKVLEKQINFRLQSALDMGIRRGVITKEVCQARLKEFNILSVDEKIYVPSENEFKKVQLKKKANARFLKDRVSYQKICKVLGITKKELFRVGDYSQPFNIDLVRTGFKNLTGMDEYWDCLQAQLDMVASYRYGKRKRYKFDQQTEVKYAEAFITANKLIRVALINAYLNDRLTTKQYVGRMDKLRFLLVNEEEPEIVKNCRNADDMYNTAVNSFSEESSVDCDSFQKKINY